MADDFWSGVRLVITGLTDAAKKASYSLGFGAGGLGVALHAVSKLNIEAPSSLLISVSVFFILARIGKAVDNHVERAALVNNLKDYLMLDKKVRGRLLPRMETYSSNLELSIDDLKQRLAELSQLQQDFQQRMNDEPQQLSNAIQKANEEAQTRLARLSDEVQELRKQLSSKSFFDKLMK